MSPTEQRRLFAGRYLEELRVLLARMPLEPLADALGLLETVQAEGRRMFIAGNGGSAATSSHMANDLLLGVAQGGGRGCRALALTDPIPVLTAAANDQGYQQVFVAQLRAWAEAGDLLIVISGSGNSPNVLRALEYGRDHGLASLGLLGQGGGAAAALCDVAIIVPSDDYGPIEDLHLILNHLLSAYLRQRAADPVG